MGRLTHFDDQGASRMVDVSQKPITLRAATASGRVRMQPATLRLIVDRKLAKGDVFEVARIAGIMAAKRTSDLVPLCHPLPLASVRIDIEASGERELLVRAECEVEAKTGVEMEALTAVAVCCLTIYDMCKSIDRDMSLLDIHLDEKAGGQSGHFVRGNCSESIQSRNECEA